MTLTAGSLMVAVIIIAAGIIGLARMQRSDPTTSQGDIKIIIFVMIIFIFFIVAVTLAFTYVLPRSSSLPNNKLAQIFTDINSETPPDTQPHDPSSFSNSADTEDTPADDTSPIDCHASQYSHPRNTMNMREEDRLMEARRQLAIGRNILLIILGFIVPILITLWNSFHKDYCDELRYLQTIIDSKPNQIKYKQIHSKASEELAAVHKLAYFIRIPFYILVALVAIVACLITIAGSPLILSGNSSALPVLLELPLICRCLADLALLLFVTLLIVHLVLVQSSLTRFRIQTGLV